MKSTHWMKCADPDLFFFKMVEGFPMASAGFYSVQHQTLKCRWTVNSLIQKYPPSVWLKQTDHDPQASLGSCSKTDCMSKERPRHTASHRISNLVRKPFKAKEVLHRLSMKHHMWRCNLHLQDFYSSNKMCRLPTSTEKGSYLQCSLYY